MCIHQNKRHISSRGVLGQDETHNIYADLQDAKLVPEVDPERR